MNTKIDKIFQALADKNRLKIIKKIHQKKKIYCNEILKSFSFSQPTLSHHLHKLVESSVLKEEKKGKFHLFEINYQFLNKNGINIKKILT